MDVHERILAAMAWQKPDMVPLTIYDWMIPRGAAERQLREMGLGIITRLPAHRLEHREVQFDSTEYWQDGRHLIRRTIRTPVGEVFQVAQLEAAYGSTWILEHYIKHPEDYAVLEFVYRDAIYRDNYAAIRQAQQVLGGDGGEDLSLCHEVAESGGVAKGQDAHLPLLPGGQLRPTEAKAVGAGLDPAVLGYDRMGSELPSLLIVRDH